MPPALLGRDRQRLDGHVDPALAAPLELHAAIHQGEDRVVLAQADVQAGAAPVSFARLLRDRSLWAVVGAKAITDPFWWLLLFWAPDLLHRRFGLGLSGTAEPLSALYVLAALNLEPTFHKV